MSKRISTHLKCTECGYIFKVNFYRSIWIEEPENRELIFQNKINAFTCPKCNKKHPGKFPFLCTNVKKKIAVWYEPYHDQEIDKDIALYASNMGVDSFYAKAPRIQNWEKFKKTIVEFERQWDAHQVQNRRPQSDSLDNKYVDTSSEEVIDTLNDMGVDMGEIDEEEIETLRKITDAAKELKKVGQTQKSPIPSSNPDLKKSEDTIMELINSGLGEKYSLAYKIEDIEELPIKEFSTIQKLLSSGEAIIRMSPGSIDGTTFRIISTPTENRLATLYTCITYIGPVIGIILSFVHTWYWLSLIVIAPIVGMRLGKKIYLHALFNRAFNSEIIFSYLFTAGKVTIELPEQGILRRKL